MILKNANNDTCISESPIDGWTEITHAELLDILASRSVQEQHIPSKVTMRQARLALLQAGLLQQVNDAVQSMQGDAGKAAQIEWEFSSEVKRNQTLTQQLSAAIGLTSSQMDALFIEASNL